MDADARWRTAAAAFWIGAGAMHFLRPQLYAPIVPPPLDRRRVEVVALSGAAELAGGIAVLPSATRPVARWWLLATLVAVYPANVWMALRPERFRGIPRWALYARLPVQGLFAWLTWRGTR